MSSSQIVEGFSLSHAQVMNGSQSFLTALAQSAVAEADDIYGVNDSSIDPDVGDYNNEGDDTIMSFWSWVNYADLSVQAGFLSLPLVANLTGRTIDTINPVAATNEVQTVTITGVPTGGNFTLTLAGQTTGNLLFSATNAQVQTALEALSNVSPGDLTVTGGPGPATPYVVTFTGGWAGQDVPQMSVANTFTGGTSPAIVATTTTAGRAASTQASAMDLWHEDSFNVAPKPMVVRIPSRDADGNPRNLAIGLYKVMFRPITFNGPTFRDGLKVNYAGRAVMASKDETGATFSDGRKRVGRILSYA